MAEEKLENPKTPGANQEEIISLSDSELDNILNSAELTDSPIEDLEINLDEEPIAEVQTEVVNDESSDSVSAEAPVVQEEISQPAETQEPSVIEGSEEGFFSDEDETIGLSSNELDNILEKASSTFENEQAEAPKDEANQQLEAPVLGESEITMEDDSVKSSPVSEETPSDTGIVEEDLPLIDESELVFDEEDRLILEDTDTGESSETSIVQEMADEDILLDEDVSIETEKQEPVQTEAVSREGTLEELSPVDEQTISTETEDNVLSVSGESVDQMIGEESDEDVLSDFQVNEEIILDEPVDLESKTVEEPSSEIQKPVDDNLFIEEESITLDENLDTTETGIQEPAQSLETEEIIIEETMVQVPAAEEESVSEPAPIEPMTEEIIIEEPVAVPPSMEETISDESADIEIISEEDITEEAPEITEEEIVFEEEEKIEAEPHDTTEEIPVVAGINESDISEMKEEIISQPESIPESGFDSAAISSGASAQVVEPEKEIFEGLTENTKEDVKQVLSYLDELFDNLPEDKIKEFAESKYYDIYNKLFNELGI